jgi:hypothetical protein
VGKFSNPLKKVKAAEVAINSELEKARLSKQKDKNERLYRPDIK